MIILVLVPIILLFGLVSTLPDIFADQSVKTKSIKCKGKAMCIVATIDRIIDGDTIVVNNKKIRLSLTSTPESYQKGGIDATDFTKYLCRTGYSVTVDQDDKQPYDKYKRVLGMVYCSGKILNAELLYAGHAHISKYFCKISEFATEDWAIKYGCKV